MTPVRRERLRTALRDLAAAAAFASMAISGLLPAWVLAVFGFSLALSLWGKRPLARRGTATALLMLLAALALYGLVAIGAMDVVLAACTFGAVISAQRMLAAPSPSTDGQVQLTSLLMVAGGAALSGDLLFSVCLALYAALATLSLGLGALEAGLPEAADAPVRPALWRLGGAAALALAGSVAFFVFFPRLSWNVAALKITPGWGATSGAAKNVVLRGDGTIKRNPRVVLRATLEPDPKADWLGGYWVMRTFSEFDGKEWVSDASPGPPQKQIALGDRPAGKLHQRIELLPAYGSSAAVALETPVLLANATGLWPSGARRIALRDVGGDEVQFSETALGYTYHAYSAANPLAAGDPVSTAAYLQLPEGLDPRIPALAREVAGDAKEPLAAARRLERYLQENYRYSLELYDDPDPLSAFLFERKEGHCEHFATALAVLLRSLGFPARVAAGFYGGERVGDHYVVRAGDAHAWTHVLVAGRGFVTVDATPPEQRRTQASSLLAWVLARYEAIEERWRASVLDYSFMDQYRAVRTAFPHRHGRAGAASPRAGALWAAAAAAALAYAAWRIPWRRKRPGAVRAEATRFLDEIEAQLARAALRPRPGESVEELSDQLAASAHPLAGPLKGATRRYLEARFGGRPLAPGERARWIAALRLAADGKGRGRGAMQVLGQGQAGH